MSEPTIKIEHAIEDVEFPFVNHCIARAKDLHSIFGGISVRFIHGDYAEFRWRGKTIAVLAVGRVPEDYSGDGLIKLDTKKEVWYLPTEYFKVGMYLARDYAWKRVTWGNWKTDWEIIFKAGMLYVLDRVTSESASILKKISKKVPVPHPETR